MRNKKSHEMEFLIWYIQVYTCKIIWYIQVLHVYFYTIQLIQKKLRGKILGHGYVNKNQTLS